MNQFLKFILEGNSTCLRQFLCPSSGVFHCTQQWYMSYKFADSLQAGAGSSWSRCRLSANLYDIYLSHKQTWPDGYINVWYKHLNRGNFSLQRHSNFIVSRWLFCGMMPCRLEASLLGIITQKMVLFIVSVVRARYLQLCKGHNCLKPVYLTLL
jgi:hypothetical protein